MATITEDYVSFEIAKLLKEKRFNEKCRTYYKVFPKDRIAAIYHSSEDRGVSEDDPNEILCPTLQMTMKWLREVHNIFISIVFCFYPTEKRVTWTPEISTFDSVFPESAIEYNSYEEATEASIRYCLENLI